MRNDFDGLISASSARWSVPFAWIKAVIGTESNFDPEAYRADPRIGDASYGLMQLLSRTAAGLGFRGDPAELFDPALNIELGTELLSQLRGSYGDDFRRVYSAYNSGNPDRWETSSEVARNVNRALDWLSRVSAESPVAVAASGAGLFFLVLGGIWFLMRRT
jgi:soluble lytic murein transglycosylase-like protein